MPTSPHDLRQIHGFPDLVRYLEDELAWPLDEYSFDDLTFEYAPAEVGLKEDDAAKIREIRQLRPLRHDQPWGIFFVEFEKKKLPVVVLRRILNHLVLKKRASANRADARRWATGDILFISAFGDTADATREIAFAHFQQQPGDLPTLRVLGWDGGDTRLHVDHVARELKARLRWPDEPADADHWREQWSRPFRHRLNHTIRTAAELAETLAAFARNIRDAARTLMAHESDRGALHRLFTAFRTALIHDLTPESFADTYAQTITYGLLTAAISRTEMSEGTRGTVILAESVTDMVPVTNPFLKEMLRTFLQAGGRRGGIDFDELGVQDVVELLRGDETDLPAILRDFGNRTRGEDPVIHFYEHFLSAYNRKLKAERGVFYTPQPVVSYIVRSVHELLQTEFGLADGLADTTTWGEMIRRRPGLRLPNLSDDPGKDQPLPESEPFVQILDPATGTGTFLVEVIDVVHHTLAAKWQRQRFTDAQRQAAWNDYVPKHLLPRLHAFELMMAPYAIAHMKIGLKLAETGYKFGTEERARIYLTNALEPKVTQLPQIGFDALAHEAEAVNEIKWRKRFTVVIGNPPYSISSSNLSEAHRAIVNPYKSINGVRIVEKGARQFEKNIQDDYVKFIRLGEVSILSAGVGVVGFITNHSYLTNPTFRGLRFSLLRSFGRSDFVDLHGNSLYGEAKEGHGDDENVFDIQQGVAICLLRRFFEVDGRSCDRIDYWGSRQQKYRELGTRSLSMDDRVPLHPGPDFWAFRSEDRALRDEYQTFPRISELLPLNSTGIKTHRDHFAISFDRDALKSRIEAFRDLTIPDDVIEEEYQLADTDAWRLSAKRRSLSSKVDWEKFIALVIHRPFDPKWIYYHPDVIELPRLEVMRNLLPRGSANVAICFPRNLREGWKYHAFVSREVVHKDALSSLDTCYAAPLFLKSDPELELPTRADPNLSKTAREWAKRIGLNLESRNCWEILAYFYAILFAPAYGSRYADFLKIDFPRRPLTGSLELFRALARLGGELVALHLLESPKLDQPRTTFIGGPHPVVEKISWSRDTVWLDKARSTGFHGVPAAVWDFHVGGYQVCEKWLKDRKGRRLSAGDVAHYHRIVVALAETIRLMTEIDRTIEAHGGWPGAFSNRTADPKGAAV